MVQNNKSSKTPSLLAWASLMTLALVWGSSYILIKKGLLAFTPLQLGSLRITIAAVAFFPSFLYFIKKFNWSHWKTLLIVGLFGNLFPAFLFAIAQTEISSSMTGVLSSLAPLFVLVVGILFYKLPFVPIKALGVLIGLTGALLLILFGTGGDAGSNPLYAVLIVIATLCYAISANTVQVKLGHLSPAEISAISFIFIALPAVVILLASDFLTVMKTSEFAWSSLGYITILSLVGTVIASLIFYRLVQMTSAVFSATVSYLVPIVAILWGYVAGENITVYHFIGMILILTGVYVAGRK